MHESGGRGCDPNGAPSNGFGCLTRRVKSYIAETRDGGILTPGQKSCPHQRPQPRTFGDEKERNVTRVFCEQRCTLLSLRRSWLLARPTDEPRRGCGCASVGRREKRLADEFAADGFRQWLEGMPSEGSGIADGYLNKTLTKRLESLRRTSCKTIISP